jgi:hypothetical protein
MLALASFGSIHLTKYTLTGYISSYISEAKQLQSDSISIAIIVFRFIFKKDF